MAVRTAGIACACDCLAVAAFAVLADEKSCVFAVHGKHALSATWAFMIGKIIMLKGAVRCFDILDQRPGVILNIMQENLLFLCAFRDVGQFHLPGGGKLRLFQIFRNQFKQLLSFGSDQDFLSLFFYQKCVE